MAIFWDRVWENHKGTESHAFTAGEDLAQHQYFKESAPGSYIAVAATTKEEAIGYVVATSRGVVIGEQFEGMLGEWIKPITGGGGGAGTVTDFIFTNGGGFTGTVGTSTSTPTLSLVFQNAAADGATKGQAAFSAADFNAAAGVVSIDYTNGQAANSTTKGFLTAADWVTFNAKLSGSGTNHEVAYWSGASTLGSSPQFTFDPAGSFGIIVPNDGVISGSGLVSIASVGSSIVFNGTTSIWTATVARVIPLSGVGTRMVVADASGNLSTQAIPSGGGTIGGSIAVNQLAFGSGVDTIIGDADFTFDPAGAFNLTATTNANITAGGDAGLNSGGNNGFLAQTAGGVQMFSANGQAAEMNSEGNAAIAFASAGTGDLSIDNNNGSLVTFNQAGNFNASFLAGFTLTGAAAGGVVQSSATGGILVSSATGEDITLLVQGNNNRIDLLDTGEITITTTNGQNMTVISDANFTVNASGTATLNGVGAFMNSGTGTVFISNAGEINLISATDEDVNIEAQGTGSVNVTANGYVVNSTAPITIATISGGWDVNITANGSLIAAGGNGSTLSLNSNGSIDLESANGGAINITSDDFLYQTANGNWVIESDGIGWSSTVHNAIIQVGNVSGNILFRTADDAPLELTAQGTGSATLTGNSVHIISDTTLNVRGLTGIYGGGLIDANFVTGLVRIGNVDLAEGATLLTVDDDLQIITIDAAIDVIVSNLATGGADEPVIADSTGALNTVTPATDGVYPSPTSITITSGIITTIV